jgi:hypothetical protein
LSAKSDSARELSDYENRVAECDERRQRIYERFILREIDRSEYLKLKAECSGEIEKLNRQAAALRAEIQAQRSKPRVITLASQAIGGTIPHRELVDAMIDKVYVFPDKRVEIAWKIEDFTNNNVEVS